MANSRLFSGLVALALGGEFTLTLLEFFIVLHSGGNFSVSFALLCFDEVLQCTVLKDDLVFSKIVVDHMKAGNDSTGIIECFGLIHVEIIGHIE